MKSRNIIIHYHLFKNAGSSLDLTLKNNFGDSWVEKESAHADSPWLPAEIEKFLSDNRSISVLSSHTAQLPLPNLSNSVFYPIIFIRHPIDRVISIFNFEKNQLIDTEGSVMARRMSIGEFIEWRLSKPEDRAIRNFQALRLASAVQDETLDEANRAIEAIKSLPFIGLVDQYDQSLTKLENWLRPAFPSIKLEPYRENATGNSINSIDERLQALKHEIGIDLFSRLVKENEIDLEIYKLTQDYYLKPK
jgi:hypothetical protein